MIYMDYIFDLGVITVIFGWLWGFISGGIAMLLAMIGLSRDISSPSLKGIGFFIMSGLIGQSTLALTSSLIGWQAGIVIFIGGLVVFFHSNANLQKTKKVVLTINNQQVNPLRLAKYETTLIFLAVFFYGLSIAFPDITYNPITAWFTNSVTFVYSLPILGWLIKIFAFFFLIGMLWRGIKATHQVLDVIQSLFNKSDEIDRR